MKKVAEFIVILAMAVFSPVGMVYEIIASGFKVGRRAIVKLID